MIPLIARVLITPLCFLLKIIIKVKTYGIINLSIKKTRWGNISFFATSTFRWKVAL